MQIVLSKNKNMNNSKGKEIIANMIAKGGFPEFILQPINFDALYKESKNRAAGISDNEDSSEETTH